MNTKQIIRTGLLAGLLSLSCASQAEDIDIYSGLGTAVNTPNVLFVMDNSANFEASSGGVTCKQQTNGSLVINASAGTATAMSGTVGGIEQCALWNVVKNLPVNADGTARLNIGFMMYNGSNITDINGLNCGGSLGGCLTQPIIAMTEANKAGVLTWIANWNTSPSASTGNVKAAGKATAATMQEAWAYYKGGTGLSTRNYSAIKPAGGCQKNFIIYVANAFSSASGPGDASSGGPLAALNTAVDNQPQPASFTATLWTAQKTDWKAAILNSVNTACGTAPGTYNFATPSSNHTENAGDYVDEWARFMHEADLYSTTPDGLQNITTYTVGLLDPTSCKAEYPALLSNMADYGGGKYFATTSYDTIVSAIMKILNEVQAVNSVFSSASLPVSVNAQGTYLNQIYMGMFRPDSGAEPRWSGNLKQFQFIVNSTSGALQLGDSLGNLAIDSSGGTGFISANAISFWTCTDLTSPYDNTYVSPNLSAADIALLVSNSQSCTEPAVGFWKNEPSSSKAAAKTFDLPDGEWVERGGAAQQLRNINLEDDYTTAAGTTTNPRKLYTYCPSGTCTADLTDSTNAFADANTAITATMFGSSITVNISAITRAGGQVTVTTSGNHGFNTSDSITIANATPDNYNGSFIITKLSNTQFTYTITEYPPALATGSYTASKPGPIKLISSLVRSGTTMIATSTAHGFTTGDVLTISGANQSQYNGSFSISNVTANSFEYTIPAVTEGPILLAGSPSGTTTATASSTIAPSVPCPAPCNKTVGINAFDQSPAAPGVVRTSGSTLVTVTTSANHSFIVGNSVVLSGVVDSSGTSVAAYSGTFTITGLPSSKSFTFITALTPAVIATGTVSASISTITHNITDLRRAGNTATATATAHGFSNGETIVIGGTPGANEDAYLGTYAISNVTTSTFDYTVVTAPASSASGAMTATRSTGFEASDRTSLINWVRGEDNQSDEASLCPTSVTTGTANCPATRVTVRPSIHGDVLHSRPTVINYGGSTGVVVYYGDNGGVFHAINGNQSTSISSVGPGEELWGFISKDHFTKLNRLRTNSPQLNLPSTPPGISPPPTKKDYFIDGATGVYQKINASGVTTQAVLYLSMRRGGNSIIALDVTDPAIPTVLWTKDNTSTGMGELGQTWSQPRVIKVKGYCGGTACSSTNKPTPVLVFGGGYDTSEDLEPPQANTSGRAIYVLDAFTGTRIWSAAYTAGSTSYTGSTTQATALISGMNYGIAADIALIDRDIDGLVDRLYASDVGGNIWRVDLQPSGNATPDNWRVRHFAALGCWSGACSLPTTTSPRKFFYPPEVLTATTAHPFDAVIAGPGDREHPLYVNTATQRYNRIVMLKDIYTGDDASLMTTPISFTGTMSLFDATSTPWDGSLNGYYITLAAGEKVVNAPLAYSNYVYMGTNQPSAPSTTSCTSSLGTAKGYRISPFTGARESVTFDGGGLPPSPVAGIVNIMVNGVEKQMTFIIGGGNPGSALGTGGSDGSSALGVQDPEIPVPTKRSRNYRYIINK